MKILKDIIADLNIFFDVFGIDIMYNDKSIKGIFTYGGNLREREDALSAEATLHVKVSDVENPEYRDTVMINNKTWKVLNINFGDGYVWELNLFSDERPQI